MSNSFAYKLVITTLLLSHIMVGNCFTGQQKGGSFEGMVGTYPIRLRWLCNKIKEINDSIGLRVPTKQFKNRMILYGPPGNGKTTVIRKIAEESGSQIFELSGPSIVHKYIGTGAQNIIDIFQQADDHVRREHTCAIIFIDEIDALANTRGEGREEHMAAAQQLWIELDKIKTKPQIIFFGATNKYNNIDNTFLDRFGSNKIEIKLPDKKTREDVLIFYKHRFTGTDWDPTLLEKMVKKTDGLNIRNIEDLVDAAHMQAELDNNNEITEELLLECLREIKLKAQEELSWGKRFDIAADKAQKGLAITGAAYAVGYTALAIYSLIVFWKNQVT